MTQEEKQLLLKDLCARLPYCIVVLDEPAGYFGKLLRIDADTVCYEGEEDEKKQTIWNIKPYLRPMSSMTEEECKTLGNIPATLENKLIEVLPNIPYYIEVAVPDQIDWLNAHHFDYRGLIEKGLALEAPEGMYESNFS